MSKYWKEAATVIIAAKSAFPKSGLAKNGLDSNNYKVLALKRSSKSSFMPDSFVFPGGNLDPADSSKEWLELFAQSGVQNSLLEPFAKHSSNESNEINIFNNKDEGISRSISLRISGIRETFEECGVLLCKSTKDTLNPKSKWASFLSGHQVQEWQKKVHDNAGEFINLFRQFKCFPDLWSLQEWSNWLSPPDFPKRFNTIFFIANLNQMPPTSSIGGEINDIKWELPQELLSSCDQQQITLPPPQYYELSRLINYSDIDKLADFAAQRSMLPTDFWMVYRLKTPDGIVSIFPGDDMYPKTLEFASKPIEKVDKTLQDLRDQSNILHRMEHTKKQSIKLLVKNLDSIQNHIIPKL